MLKIVTIGVYGFDADTFFAKLQEAHVDTFCDIRLRRGVRGPDYTFANSQRLQQHLQTLGIRYIHAKQLAPTLAIRSLQTQADEHEGIAKRKRQELSPAFIQAYQHECLAHFDSAEFMQSLGPAAHVVALFCVEHAPEACHRSLVAEKLAQDLSLPVVHIL